MDLVFKRYSSPFLFLDIFIENNDFSRLIDEMYKLKSEDRWWEMYLATLPLNDKSYDDWRKQSTKSNTTTSTENISKEYVETAIEKSKNILSNFKPPK